jgi:hypothetical protein
MCAPTEDRGYDQAKCTRKVQFAALIVRFATLRKTHESLGAGLGWAVMERERNCAAWDGGARERGRRSAGQAWVCGHRRALRRARPRGPWVRSCGERRRRTRRLRQWPLFVKRNPRTVSGVLWLAARRRPGCQGAAWVQRAGSPMGRVHWVRLVVSGTKARMTPRAARQPT